MLRELGRPRLLALAALVVAAGLAGIGAAAIPSADGVVTACYTPRGGSGVRIELIDSEAGETCTERQVQIQWYGRAGADARFLAIDAKAGDADRLDGLDSADFATPDSAWTTVLARDGAGSGLDSDLLDGLDSTQFVSAAGGALNGNLILNGRLGFNQLSPQTTIHMRDPVVREDNFDASRSWWQRLNSAGFEYVLGTSANLADSQIKLRLDYGGNLSVVGAVNAGGGSSVGDIAEPVTAIGLAPWDVVASDGFDEAGKLKARKVDTAYSRSVIGIVSRNPSLVLAGASTETPLAVTGIVPVKVTGRVAADDLLVSSAVPGHAMACRRSSACFGAVLGKALESHRGPGPGWVRVLVSLG